VLQPYVSLMTLTTRDATPPAFLYVHGYYANGTFYNISTPEVYVGAITVDVAASLDEPATAFLLVQAPATQAPTARQSDEISHIDTKDDRIDTVISYIIRPYPISIFTSISH